MPQKAQAPPAQSILPDERTDPCRFFKPSREICECLACHPQYAPTATCRSRAGGASTTERRLDMDDEDADPCRCVSCQGIQCTCDSSECRCERGACFCHVGTQHGCEARQCCWCTSKVFHRVHKETKANGSEKARRTQRVDCTRTHLTPFSHST